MLFQRTKSGDAARRRLLVGRVSGDGLALAGSGTWTAENARTLEPLLDAATRRTSLRQVVIDLSRVESIDTYGAWLIERALRNWRSRGCATQVTGLSENYQDLFAKVHAGTHAMTPEPPRPNAVIATLESVGRTMTEVWLDLISLMRMAGALIVAFGRVLIRPRTFRFNATVKHLERVAWNAVPIILLMTILIGAILAQQGIFHFRQFGAAIYVVDMIGVLVLREVGVLIVCIMVAGRSGSAYTAELGSMKMREEIDALRIMGFDPAEVLILPRIIALIIAVPILTFIGSMAALYGGGVVAWLYGGIRPEVFLARLHDAVSIKSFVVGMVKAPFMAIVIGLVACAEGLKVEGSAELLGSRTTQAVVKSIFLVILLDGGFAIFFASIGI